MRLNSCRPSNRNRGLKAVQPAAVEAAVQASEEESHRQDEVLESLRRDLEAARYAAQRAQRQFDAADPENRLVTDASPANCMASPDEVAVGASYLLGPDAGFCDRQRPPNRWWCDRGHACRFVAEPRLNEQPLSQNDRSLENAKTQIRKK